MLFDLVEPRKKKHLVFSLAGGMASSPSCSSSAVVASSFALRFGSGVFLIFKFLSFLILLLLCCIVCPFPSLLSCRLRKLKSNSVRFLLHSDLLGFDVLSLVCVDVLTVCLVDVSSSAG